MLDTLKIVSMQFSKDGLVGTIHQEEDGRYMIMFENNAYYCFSYEQFQTMKDVMDQFTIKKSVIDFDRINKFDDVPF